MIENYYMYLLNHIHKYIFCGCYSRQNIKWGFYPGRYKYFYLENIVLGFVTKRDIFYLHFYDIYMYSPFKPQCSAKYLIFWGGVPKYYGATQDPECLIDMFVCYTKGRSIPTSYHLPMHLFSSFIYTFSPLFSSFRLLRVE